jgi:polysaccharide export outer membrane protein
MASRFSFFALVIGLVFVMASFVARAEAAPQGTAAGSTPPPRPTVVQGFSSYRLGPGDLINILVLGEEDLSLRRIRITDAGTLSYPTSGEIYVLGLTTGEVERLITEGLLGRYLKNPRVSVNIEEYRPFYINGMVGRPGGYPFQPGLTVRKAVALAGGFLERASTSKIYVIREGEAEKGSQKVALDEPLLPGDIVTVEESFF